MGLAGLSGLLSLSEKIIDAVKDTLMNTIIDWIYELVFDAAADFFSMMGNMGGDLFNLAWIQATVNLFTIFGWSLFIAGTIVAVFDLAIEYQNGRGSIKTTLLNILKGFFACSLIGIVPIELYRLCITLQNSLGHDLIRVFTGVNGYSIGTMGIVIMREYFTPVDVVWNSLFMLLALIAFVYCEIKIFFQNIKRGGILLVQISVGSLYMFSVPRGYTDGFTQWMKQIAALCLTAFMQTTVLFLGLITFQANMLLGLGLMLSASEVPRIAQQFGLDSSTKINVSGMVSTASTAFNLSRMMATKGK